MPTLTVNGQSVQVDDSFTSLSPDQQNATVDDIAKNLGAAPEKAPEQPSGLGQLARDAGRFGMTAVTRGLGGLADFATDPLAPARRLVSPDLERIEQSGKFQPGQAAGNAVFGATGVPEYQPTTPLGRVGLSAAEGAVGGGPFGIGGAITGTLSGAFGQGTQEATGNERLATAAGLVPGFAAGARAGMRDNSPAPPSAQTLKAAGSAGYDAARASNATIPGQDIADMSRQLQQTLQGDHGVIAKTAPKTYAILDELANPQAGAFGTYSGLEAARRGLSTIAGEGGTEGFAAQKAIPELNKFIDAVAPEAADARANYAAGMRSNSLTGTLDRANTGILERAENRAQAANSGRNLDNAIRQRVEALLERPRELSGFSDAEIEALNKVVQGGAARNAARYIGNLFGGGGGLGQAVTGGIGAGLGAVAGGGVPGAVAGAAVPGVIGAASKSLANALARRSLGKADEAVRSNSPLYREMLSQPLDPRTAAVLRAVLPGLLAQPQQPQGGLLAPQPAPTGLLGYF